MRRGYILALIIPLFVQDSCGETFVKPRKQRGVSTAALQEECGTLIADILDLSQCCLQQLFTSCSQNLLSIQQTIIRIVRCFLNDETSCLSGASKAVLSEKKERLTQLKKRFQKSHHELEKLNNELHAIKKELQEFEAAR